MNLFRYLGSKRPFGKKVQSLAQHAIAGGAESVGDRLSEYRQVRSESQNIKNTMKKTQTKKKTPASKTEKKKIVAKKTNTKKEAVKKPISKKVSVRSGRKIVLKKQEKGTAKKNEEKMTLMHAGDDVAFWVYEGPILKNLLDLHDALEAISEDQYLYHARSKEDNDFANWVEAVLCDGDCATMLKKARDRNRAGQVVRTRLRVYSV